MKAIHRIWPKLSLGLFTAIVLSTSLLPKAAAQGDGSPKPGAAHKQLEVFVGDWSYTGEYKATPITPAGKYKGKESSRMVLNGFYFESRWEEEIEGAGTGRGIAIVGYDPAKKVYVDHIFVSDGSYSSAVSSVSGNVWTAHGTASDPSGKVYKIRIVRTLSADGKVCDIKAEYSPDDGKSWKPWWTQTGKKA